MLYFHTGGICFAKAFLWLKGDAISRCGALIFSGVLVEGAQYEI